MSSADFADRLNEAIDLARSGQTIEARALLRDLVHDNPNLELAWMWLATVAETPQERIEALQNTVRINPGNEKARAALQALSSTPELPDAEPRRLVAADIAPSDDLAPRGLPINAVLIGLIVIVLVGGLVLLGTAVGRAAYRPTLTPSETDTPTATLKYSLTPTRTPGGPSDTPMVFGTAPDTWTPVASLTPLPTITPLPPLEAVPTITLVTTDTPFPTDTTFPTITPYLTPTITETESATSDITPSATPDGTLPPTLTPFPTSAFSFPSGGYVTVAAP